MDDQHPDRMATPRRRGQPPKYGVGAPTPPPAAEPQPAEVVAIPQPPVEGIRCPSCGRGMVPRRYRGGGEGGTGYASCPLCGKRMELSTSDAGRLQVRLL